MKLKYILIGIMVSWASIALSTPPKIHLSGTVVYDNELAAFVDSEIYKVNDEIAGYRIMRVDEYGMTVQKEGESKTYYIAIGNSSNATLLEKTEATHEPVAPSPNLKPEFRERDPSVSFTPAQEKESSLDLIKWIFSIALMGIGVILSITGGIWFLVEAFRTTIWWGLGCFFISIVELIFLIMHWDRAAKPFGLSVLGGVIMLVGIVIAPGSFEQQY